MPPNSWGPLSQLTSLLLLGLCTGTDVFCGQLTVYKQQWFTKETQTLGARMSTDLRDCLNFCCGIPDCQAVTFMGFLSRNTPNPTANCVMFQCGPSGECQTVTNPVATDGVISVVIKRDAFLSNQLQAKVQDEMAVDITSSSTTPRTTTRPSNTSQTTPGKTELASESTPRDRTLATTTMTFSEEEDDNGAIELEPSQHTKTLTVNDPTVTTPMSIISTTEISALADLAPIWLIGILIVVAVTCAGTCLILLSVYFCVRRSKTKMRSQPITSLKTPTLHAFNPTSLHTTSTMA